MGEIADMMLDGTLCEWCGVYIEDSLDIPGYPRLCPACKAEKKKEEKRSLLQKKKRLKQRVKSKNRRSK